MDPQALGALRAHVEKRIRYLERRKAMSPLFDALSKDVRHISGEAVPTIVGGPEAGVRRSVLALEERLKEFPAKMAEAEASMTRLLNSARRRTAELEAWLARLA